MEGSEENNGLTKGPWSTEEDQKLIDYIKNNGQANWQTIPKKAGLNRCGKSCRLRWTNYLKPGIKRGSFSDEEEATIIFLHKKLGNKWSRIAAQLPRRTDNEIKNYWNTHLRKKLLRKGIDPKTHRPIPPPDINILNLSQADQLLMASNLHSFMNRFDAAALSLPPNPNDLIKIQIIQNILQNPSPLLPYINPGNLNLGGLLHSGSHLPNGINNNFIVDPLQAVHHPSSMISDFSSISALLNQQPSTSNSFPCFDGETIPAGLNMNNDTVRSSSSHNSMYNSSEYSLPSLVSITPESCTVNKVESIQQISTITTDQSDQHTTHTNVFDAWENFMDDEANSSFWKNILG